MNNVMKQIAIFQSPLAAPGAWMILERMNMCQHLTKTGIKTASGKFIQ